MSLVAVAIQNAMLGIEDRGKQVPKSGFCSQVIYKMINENFPYFSGSDSDMYVDDILYQCTLTWMSDAGRLTVAFKPTSQMMMLQNFCTLNSAEGYRTAGWFQNNSNRDQQNHAAKFFCNYSEQVRHNMNREAQKEAD